MNRRSPLPQPEIVVPPHVCASPISLHVNGAEHRIAAAPDTPLLTVLRNDLGLNGPKYGCGLGQCGACTVLVDGTAARACVIPLAGAAGRRITTLEGLGTRSRPHPVQQAFIDEQAAQCGYCLNGMIVAAVALLQHTPHPGEAEIRAALSGNLCRCGTHVEIVRAVQKAALLLERQAVREPDAVPGATQANATLSHAAQPNATQPEAC
ncbi:MAG: (2Fe-2S)-binding protein [Burkholderiaceae bacterium]|nr:(2Fe-2S)-binding protein [Burkholderiaceae bacterium]